MDDAEGKFLSVVFRSTDAWTRNDNSLAITVASLFTALPHKSDPLISELIALSGDTPETWFRHYTRIILKPVLAMYLIYGVALEAHQQNTQVLFDDSGRAVAMLIRDFGDGAAGPRHSVSRVTNSNLISGTAFYPRCLKMILNPSEPSSWMLALSVICMKSPFA